jgi:hypothetical protein
MLCYYSLNMRSLAAIIGTVLGAGILLAAVYTVKSVKVLPIESYSAQTSIGGVTIAADPYSTDEKSFSAFDVRDLNSRGYFPIHIIIQNKSPDFLSIHTRNVLLVTKEGEQLYTTPSSLVVEDVVDSGLSNTTALTDFTGKELTNRWIDPGMVTDGFLFFYTPEPKVDLFEGSTLYIPKLEREGTGEAMGPFLIPLNSALRSSE